MSGDPRRGRGTHHRTRPADQGPSEQDHLVRNRRAGHRGAQPDSQQPKRRVDRATHCRAPDGKELAAHNYSGRRVACDLGEARTLVQRSRPEELSTWWLMVRIGLKIWTCCSLAQWSAAASDAVTSPDR